MSRINSRQKGKRIELEAAKFLSGLGFTARRGQQFKGGADSPDLIVDELSRVHIEVKGVQGIDLGTKALLDAMMQAQDDGHGKAWALLWKRNRSCWRLSFWMPDIDHDGAPIAVTSDVPEEMARVLRWLERV